MRVHHVPVRRNTPVHVPEDLIAQLPSQVCLTTNAQFLNKLTDIQQQLENAGKKVIFYQPRHTWNQGQILGCSTETMDAESFLSIGEGLFHPQALAYATEAPVFLYDPINNKTGIVDREEIEARKKKREAGIKMFYHAHKIGVLVSTKSGQKDLIALQRLREEYPEKTFYGFIGNTIDLQSLEDFPFVEIWLNTACPRIGYDDIYKTTR